MTPDNIDTEALRELEAKATPGPWSYGIYYHRAGVNDGTHTDWDVPASIGRGRCAGCAGSAAPCADVFVEDGRTYHGFDSPASIDDGIDDDGNEMNERPDWHLIVSTSKRVPITGNYDYESGGVKSSEDDTRLIVALRNAAPALLATVEAQRKEIEAGRAVGSSLYQGAEALIAERDDLREILNDVRNDRDRLGAERDALKAEVERLTAERLNLIGESGAASTRANRLKAEVERLRAALQAAANSLWSIQGLAGKDEYMLEHAEVRAYAGNRATVADAALRGEEAPRG